MLETERVAVVDFAARDHLLQFFQGEKRERGEQLLIRIRLVRGFL